MQEIIVGIIGVAVAALVAYKIYGFFFIKSEKGTSCGCSSCGCNTRKPNKAA